MPRPQPLAPHDPQQIGPYHLTGFLGAGGQGSVYLGETPEGLPVAIKVLHAHFARDEAARERFVREVETARKVADFTARVLDVAVHQGLPYIVSEYIPGESLDDLIARDGPYDPSRLTRLASGTLTALVTIHAAGIVHCDFKPANVLIGPDGPRVIDFGIARALDTIAPQASRQIGTPAYMAPEQITQGAIGAHSDMFAWGVTMVYAATGTPAFGVPTDRTGHSVMHRILNDTPDLTGLPQPLRDLVAATLTKQSQHRPTAHEAWLTLLGRPTPPRPGTPTTHTGQAGQAPRDEIAPDAQPAVAQPTGNASAPDVHAPPAAVSLDRTPAPATDGEPPAAAAQPAPSTTGDNPPAAPDTTTSPPHPPQSASQGAASPRLRPHISRRTRRLAVGASAATIAVILTVIIVVANMNDPTGGNSTGAPTRSTTPPAIPFGTQIGAPLTGHTDAVNSVAYGQLGNRPIAVTGSNDNTVRVWDLTDHRQLGAPLTGHTSTVWSVAYGQLGNRPIAVTGSNDNTVRVWDLTDHRQLGAPLTGHTDAVYSVAYGQLGNRPIAVTGSNDNTVRVWDLTDHRQLGAPLTGHTDAVYSVAYGQLGNRPIAVTGSNDNTVRVWDLTDHRQLDPPLTGHTDAVNSVAYGQLGNRPIAVTGSNDNTVRVWDLTDHRQLDPPLTGHTSTVWSVAYGQLGNRPIAVTGSNDNTVRVWDLTDHRQLDPPLTGHIDAVNSVAYGQLGNRPIAITGSYDKTVRVWSLGP